MRVFIAGGGTGGHLYPGISVYEELSTLGVECTFLVSNKGLEKDILLSKNISNFIEQDLIGFNNYSLKNKIVSLKKVFLCFLSLIKKISSEDIVFVTGGFVSIPASLVSIFKGSKLFIHEQNSVLGLANRIFSKKAFKFFVSFDTTKLAPSGAIITGNPIRKELMYGKLKKESTKNILVLGGSGGSRRINDLISSVSKELTNKGYSIHHQTGQKLYDETIKKYNQNYADFSANGVSVFPYIDDMKREYDWCDIVVGRAGSGVIFETLHAKRPAIYIPFAQSANNHQYINALQIKNKGCCEIIEEKDTSDIKFIELIDTVFSNIENYKKNISSIKLFNSANYIAEEILNKKRD